jgi:hypothetical protein
MLEQREKGWAASGFLEFHSETGTEGGFWAFQSDDPKYRHTLDDLVGGNCPWRGTSYCPAKESRSGEHCRYEGLHVLENGDSLGLLDPDYGHLIHFFDDLQFSKMTSYEEGVGGLATHNHPVSPAIPVEIWAHFFFKSYPGILLTKEFPFMEVKDG